MEYLTDRFDNRVVDSIPLGLLVVLEKSVRLGRGSGREQKSYIRSTLNAKELNVSVTRKSLPRIYREDQIVIPVRSDVGIEAYVVYSFDLPRAPERLRKLFATVNSQPRTDEGHKRKETAITQLNYEFPLWAKAMGFNVVDDDLRVILLT